MIRAIAGTHTVIRYLVHDPRLSEPARATIENAAAGGEQVALSITPAEIVYLAERGRIPAETLDRWLQAVDAKDVVLAEVPFERSVAGAMVGIPREEVADLPVSRESRPAGVRTPVGVLHKGPHNRLRGD